MKNTVFTVFTGVTAEQMLDTVLLIKSRRSNELLGVPLKSLESCCKLIKVSVPFYRIIKDDIDN